MYNALKFFVDSARVLGAVLMELASLLWGAATRGLKGFVSPTGARTGTLVPVGLLRIVLVGKESSCTALATGLLIASVS